MRRWEVVRALMSGERTMEHICRLCGAVRRSTRAIEDCQRERTPSRPALRLVPTEPKPTPERVPRVSEHAKLRLAQHLYGIDPDKLEQNILTDTVRNGILAGARFITRPDGLRLPIAEDGTIATVLPRRQMEKMPVKTRPRIEPTLRSELADFFYQELAQEMFS